MTTLLEVHGARKYSQHGAQRANQMPLESQLEIPYKYIITIVIARLATPEMGTKAGGRRRNAR